MALHNIKCLNLSLRRRLVFQDLLHHHNNNNLPSSKVATLDRQMVTLNLLNLHPLPVLARIGVF